MRAAATALATVLLAACGATAEQSQPGAAVGPVRISTQKTVYMLPVLLGTQQGIFAKHGIDVRSIEQPPAIQGVQFLLSGGADVAFIGPHTLGQAIQQGSDLTYFCGGFTEAPMSIVIKKGSAALPNVSAGASWQQVLQGVRGKTFAMVTGPGSGLYNLIVASLKDAGVGINDVTTINTGAGLPVVTTALTTNQAQAALVLSPTRESLIADGVAEEVLYLPKGPAQWSAAQNYGGAWIARKSWLASHQKEATLLCDGMKETYSYMQAPANAPVVDAKFQESFGVSAAAAKLVREQSLATFRVEVPVKALENTVTAAVAMGVLKPEPALTTGALLAGSAPRTQG